MNIFRIGAATVRKRLAVLIMISLLGGAVLAVAYPIVAAAGGGSLAGY